MLTRLRHVDTIVSCDGADTVYRNCDLWFLDGVIARIGTWNQTPDREHQEREKARSPERPAPVTATRERNQNHRRARGPPLPRRAPSVEEERCAGKQNHEQRKNENLPFERL